MNSITPKDAQFELETGKALMLDIREPMDFEFVTFDVENVVNVPLRKLTDAMHKYEVAKRLIIADFDESLSPNATQILEQNGYVNVVYLLGGMKNWNHEQLPLQYNVDSGCDDSGCHSCSGCGH